MKNKLRLVAIFAIVMLFSFIPETFPDFFGDWVCEGSKLIRVNDIYTVEGCTYGGYGSHNPSTHWGFRHWVWTACGVSLFIWNVIELIGSEYDK